MFDLLYFFESNKGYQEFMEFYTNGGVAMGKTYLIFNEDVNCRDGRTFRVHNNILLAVNFISSKLEIYEIIKKMIEFGLDPDSLVNIYNLAFDGLDPDDVVSERAKRIISEKKLIIFLNKLDFQFKDGSVLTPSELGAAMEELDKKWGLQT